MCMYVIDYWLLIVDWIIDFIVAFYYLVCVFMIVLIIADF
jgi:hypothetical protein